MALGPNHDPRPRDPFSVADENFSLATGDTIAEIAGHLGDNKVVGLVRGSMEFGPRALCKRSMIYHATDPTINEWLNRRLNRTEFMPFAPVTAENLAEMCYIDWEASHTCAHFMTMTYDCTDLMKSRCPAVVHIDGTARPQIVTRDADPFMYELLNTWFEATGEPCLINTSFNRHEEPIIDTAEQAYTALRSGVVDAVVVGDANVVTRRKVEAYPEPLKVRVDAA